MAHWERGTRTAQPHGGLRVLWQFAGELTILMQFDTIEYGGG